MVSREDILKTALELTTGERKKSYGDPYTNHKNIADIWSVILGCRVTPSQVALCMVGVKLARLVETPDHLDSFIDGAAYMAIAAEVVDTPIRSDNGYSKTRPVQSKTKSTNQHPKAKGQLQS